jgi:hypothetical protein
MSHNRTRYYILTLQPQDIADNFTLVQIEARITAIMTAIANAEQSVSDSFQDTQASQTVRRQTLENLNNTLAVWLKAKSILTGATSSTAEILAGKYNPSWPKL